MIFEQFLHVDREQFDLTCSTDRSHIEEERVAEAFDRLDSDDSGYISTRDLRNFLGKDASMKRIDELIKDADVDHDGQSKSFNLRGEIQLSIIPV